MSNLPPRIQQLGVTGYEPVWQRMKDFTDQRDQQTRDELWLTEHLPVYTQGLNGRAEHLLNPQGIPVVQVDRGGQITYHGPGQLVVYCLLDLKRLGLGIRQLVSHIENAIIRLLADFDIASEARSDAPGVYVEQAKIAALGLRIRKGYCYHGLSLNLDMDLSPFDGINPCGYEDLKVTQLKNLVTDFSFEQVSDTLCSYLVDSLGYEQQAQG